MSQNISNGKITIFEVSFSSIDVIVHLFSKSGCKQLLIVTAFLFVVLDDLT